MNILEVSTAKKILRVVVCVFACIGFVLVMAYIAVELGLTKTKGIIDSQHDYFKNQLTSKTATDMPQPQGTATQSDPSKLFEHDTWNEGDEWQTLKVAITKDKEPILRAAQTAGVRPRLLVSILIVEQLRLFHSNRELFKSVFGPLKMLAVQSQFSWGVMGIKQDTARQVEAYLKDPSSLWYLGVSAEHLLDFKTIDPDNERFERLTNEDDRYYSYLYAAIIAKQLQSQWEKSGFDISERPDITATLYDIGFEHSLPHASPLSGGAEIEIGNRTYSFGKLAGKFYASSEVVSEFPQ